MIVTAALAWFDEAPEDLDKYVRALPIAVDRLVAYDGGYVHYPGAKARSPKAEAAAIQEAAADVGLPVKIVRPDVIWPGQIAKRSALIADAADGSDWVFTLDADHILHGIRETFRRELEYVEVEHAVDVPFYTTPNYDKPLDEVASTDWHVVTAGAWAPNVKLLVRALPGLRVETTHWWYSAIRDDGTRVWLWGGDSRYPAASFHTLTSPFFVEHRCFYRRQRNILANREFCAASQELLSTTGSEDGPT